MNDDLLSLIVAPLLAWDAVLLWRGYCALFQAIREDTKNGTR